MPIFGASTGPTLPKPYQNSNSSGPDGNRQLLVRGGDGSFRSEGTTNMMSRARQFRTGNFPNSDLWDTPQPIFRPLNRYSIWMPPPVPYTDMQYAYQMDPEIKFGIDFISSVLFGNGFYFTAPHDRVVQHFTDFAEDINLEHIVQTAGKEMLMCGDSMWRYATYEHSGPAFDTLIQLPLTTLKRIWWNGWEQDSTIGFYEFRGYAIRRYVPKEIIHFRNNIVNGTPYGYGIIAPLVQKVSYLLNWNGLDTTYFRSTIFDIRQSIMDTGHKIIKRYVPRNAYVLEGASPQQGTQTQGALNQLSDEMDMVFTPNPGDNITIQELGNQTKAIDIESFDSLYNNAVRKCLGNSVSKLFEDGSLTEASSNVAKQMTLINFVGTQRLYEEQIKRNILKAWYDYNPCVDANGVVYPWKALGLKVQWGEPDKIEIDMQGLAQLFGQIGHALTVKDIRTILHDLANLPIDPDEMPSEQEQNMGQQRQIQRNLFNNLAGNNQNNPDKIRAIESLARAIKSR